MQSRTVTHDGRTNRLVTGKNRDLQGVPPARPQLSITGALPGALHGLWRYISSVGCPTLRRFTVQVSGLLLVGCIVLLQMLCCTRPEIESQVGHPIKQP